MKTKKWLTSALLGACLIVPAVAAETPPEVKPPEEKPPVEDQVPTGKAADLAKKYDMPEKDIAALRDKGMGWGEIKHALDIAKRADKPLADVVALRESGLGWGQVAQKYGFKLGEVAGKGSDKKDRGDKTDRGGRGDKMGRHDAGPHGGGRGPQDHGRGGGGGRSR